MLRALITECFCRWKQYLFEKRNKYYHLNHFNIHQLTYLCKELSCIKDDKLPDQVYQLLSNIAGEVSLTNILKDLERATKFIEASENTDVKVTRQGKTRIDQN